MEREWSVQVNGKESIVEKQRIEKTEFGFK